MKLSSLLHGRGGENLLFLVFLSVESLKTHGFARLLGCN